MTVRPSEVPIAKRSAALLKSLGVVRQGWAPSELLLYLLTVEADRQTAGSPLAQQREFVEETLLLGTEEEQADFLLDDEDRNVDPSDPDELRTLLLDLLHGAMLAKVPWYHPSPLLP